MLRSLTFVSYDREVHENEECRFLDARLCGSCKNRHFGGTYRFHYQGDKNRELDSCHPDDGGATFFRNVGSYKSHTV
jgi:hypothetical protein